MALKKYKVVNLPEGAKLLKSGKYGDLNIDRMTDEQAEMLFLDGSRYVEKRNTEAVGVKKKKSVEPTADSIED